MTEISFIDWIGRIKPPPSNLDELRKCIAELEAFGKFESAKKLAEWEERFQECIQEEFDAEPLVPPAESFGR